jgi:hypothetical protein
MLRDCIASFMLGVEAAERPDARHIHVRVFGKDYDMISMRDVPFPVVYMMGIQSTGYLSSAAFAASARKGLTPKF